MSIKQYRFVSPGVQVREIDNSQLPKAPQAIGPLVIGRADRGVSMRPIQLESFSEYVEVFGNPVPGGEGGDIWRTGNRTSPMYAGYAAQAFLANQTPLTFLRLLGYHHPDRTAGSVEAGWTTEIAYGLFIAPTTLSGGAATDAALTAVIYAPSDTTDIGLTGNDVGGNPVDQKTAAWVASQGNDFEFVVEVGDKKYPFNLARTSKKFIRRVLNTNPTLTNDEITTSGNLEDYWLGETYEAHLESIVPSSASPTGQAAAILLPLQDSGVTTVFDKADLQLEAQPPVTSWVISQHTEEFNLMEYSASTLEVAGTKKLFRFKGLNDGEWASKKLRVGFQDIKASDDEFNPYGTFTVMLRVTSDSDNAPEYVERYANCNLDPNSTNYIARKIGDMESTWDYAESRYKMTGQHPNVSRFVSVEMDLDVDAGSTDAELLPFGFYGPAQPRPDLATSNGALDGGVVTDNAGETAAALDPGTAAVDIEAGPVPNTGSLLQWDGTASPPFRLNWPATACRTASTVGNLSNGRRSFFGVTSNQSNGVKEDPSYQDFTRPYSSTLSDGAGIVDEAFPQLKSDGAFAGDAFVGLGAELVGTNSLATGVPTVNPVDTNTVVVTTVPALALDTFVFKPTLTVPAVPGEVLIGTDLEESLNNLVAVVNASTTECRMSLIINDDNYTLCVRPTPNSTLTSITSIAETIDGADVWTADASTFSADDVKNAAGDYFANGMVPYFSLDDLVQQDVQNGGGVVLKSQQHVDWLPGSRFSGASVTVRGSTQENYDADCILGDATATGTYKDILEFGYDQFSLPLVAGFDGLDITEKDPFRNTLLADKNELNHYAFNSVKRGIDTVADPEVLDMNLATVPGITNPALTTHLSEVCRDRGDALAIMDLQNDYVPRHEGVLAEADRLPNPSLAITSLKDRRINNSYGCAYFPWVQARDTISDAVFWAPPSVAALGTMAYSETRPGSALWFAPAGFNRGGLTEGAAGIPITNTRYRLTSKERDNLYEANINPIASFPSEGIVIFGNKTLQVTPSALDRVNVRRLMIFLKKEVSRIANGILFDQNVRTTWARFTSQVNPLLASVKSQFGLSDFKVVLDETTTTPDLIDRNILYAKIFLKPARAIEFIAVDFNITRTGASFTD